jgi:hypothetical protein
MLRCLPTVNKFWSLQMWGLKPSWGEKVGHSIVTTSICPGHETSMGMGRNRPSQPASSFRSAVLPSLVLRWYIARYKNISVPSAVYKMCNHFWQICMFNYWLQYCHVWFSLCFSGLMWKLWRSNCIRRLETDLCRHLISVRNICHQPPLWYQIHGAYGKEIPCICETSDKSLPLDPVLIH